MNKRIVRADELKLGDVFHPPGWSCVFVDGCKVTDIVGPFHPHVRVATRTVNFPDRVCMRVQLDSLSWVLLDVDQEIELL